MAIEVAERTIDSLNIDSQFLADTLVDKFGEFPRVKVDIRNATSSMGHVTQKGGEVYDVTFSVRPLSGKGANAVRFYSVHPSKHSNEIVCSPYLRDQIIINNLHTLDQYEAARGAFLKFRDLNENIQKYLSSISKGVEVGLLYHTMSEEIVKQSHRAWLIDTDKITD